MTVVFNQRKFNMDYPIKIKTTYEFISELYECEFGLYEDTCNEREDGENTEVVFCDFGYRHPSMSRELDRRGKNFSRKRATIEVQNDDELSALYYALASGTINQWSEFDLKIKRIKNKIRDKVREINPELVALWS
jgi:hypothetical protein|tara:strand:- start:5 stop:409 length:405 start_codon:yes stop_codon:yes gene_type:complete